MRDFNAKSVNALIAVGTSKERIEAFVSAIPAIAKGEAGTVVIRSDETVLVCHLCRRKSFVTFYLSFDYLSACGNCLPMEIKKIIAMRRLCTQD